MIKLLFVVLVALRCESEAKSILDLPLYAGCYALKVCKKLGTDEEAEGFIYNIYENRDKYTECLDKMSKEGKDFYTEYFSKKLGKDLKTLNETNSAVCEDGNFGPAVGNTFSEYFHEVSAIRKNEPNSTLAKDLESFQKCLKPYQDKCIYFLLVELFPVYISNGLKVPSIELTEEDLRNFYDYSNRFDSSHSVIPDEDFPDSDDFSNNSNLSRSLIPGEINYEQSSGFY